MSDADLEAKFHGLVEGVLPREQSERLIERCWRAAELDNVAQLARLAVPMGNAPAQKQR
jgi:hypothetical protein